MCLDWWLFEIRFLIAIFRLCLCTLFKVCNLPLPMCRLKIKADMNCQLLKMMVLIMRYSQKRIFWKCHCTTKTEIFISAMLEKQTVKMKKRKI